MKPTGKIFGLLGKNLSHSFSADYFNRKFSAEGYSGYTYRNFELASIGEFPALRKKTPGLAGLNVTTPYKEAIIPFVDGLSGDAATVGAVNCIVFRDGKSIGYNTDIYGFGRSIQPFLEPRHDRAIILGTGGAAKAVAFALTKFPIELHFVTSDPVKAKKGPVLYKNVTPAMLAACRLVVNCTPVGMHPHEEVCPDLPYDAFTAEHLAYDLIYNPAETLFLKKAKAAGASTLNGLSMLHQQAEKSWEIWQQGKA